MLCLSTPLLQISSRVERVHIQVGSHHTVPRARSVLLVEAAAVGSLCAMDPLCPVRS